MLQVNLAEKKEKTAWHTVVDLPYRCHLPRGALIQSYFISRIVSSMILTSQIKFSKSCNILKTQRN